MAGLVLCGGSSSRMGRDKALLVFDGMPLWQRVYARMAEVASPVLFAPGRKGRLGELPGEQVDDPIPDAGPLAALTAGLRAAPHPLLATVAVDMPWCSAPLFSHLASRVEGHDVAVPVDDRGPQVLHSVFATRVANRAEEALAAGVRSMKTFIETLDVSYVTESEWKSLDPSRSFAANLNAPEDLAHFLP